MSFSGKENFISAASFAEQASQRMLVCHDCDLLIPGCDIAEGRVAKCPRCKAVLFRHKKNSVNRTLAYSISGLMLYLPANLLPLLSFEAMGGHTINAMYKGVKVLWSQGYWWMAFLVFLCSMLMPLIELLILFFIALNLKLRRRSKLLAPFAKLAHLISQWGMLDVYLLGILVAIIKMGDIGDILVGPALWAYVALMGCSIATAVSYDEHEVWQYLDAARPLARVQGSTTGLDS